MLDLISHHQAYQIPSGESRKNNNSFLYPVLSISVFLLFTFVLSFFLWTEEEKIPTINSSKHTNFVYVHSTHFLNHKNYLDEIIYDDLLERSVTHFKTRKDKEILFSQKKYFSKLYNFKNYPDEIIYDDLLERSVTHFKTQKDKEILSSQKKHFSKLEGVSDNYINYYSKTPAVYQGNFLPKKSKLLEKINFSKNLSKKKREFISVVLPIAINQNNTILSQRKKIVDLKNYLINRKTLSKTDQNFLEDLANKYFITTKNRHKIDVIDDLLLSLDIIPNSIVLAQAANESGWGSSRFARDFNALFGEYTYDKNLGIVPIQREEGKKHLIKYFSTIDQSVESYFININRHSAYGKFRKFRKLLRDHNKIININLLVNKLDVYAEDNNYVDTIISIIRYNNLTQYDSIINLTTKS